MPAPSPPSTTQHYVRFIVPYFSARARTITLSLTHVSALFLALGHAIATQGRSLVYGGGSRGIMGIISGAVLQHGGSVTAIMPAAMLRAGGEGEPSPTGGHIELEEKGREKVRTSVLKKRLT
jgi:predicted Rossmann-fold nucleotide-binding protein